MHIDEEFSFFLKMTNNITKKYIEGLTYEILGCAIEINKELGPGLLESAYEKCLIYLLEQKGFQIKSQVYLPIKFKEIIIEKGYRLDILVDDLIIVEIKAVDEISSLHEAQLLTQLHMAKMPKGILINFNTKNIFYEGQRTFVTKDYQSLPEE